VFGRSLAEGYLELKVAVLREGRGHRMGRALKGESSDLC